MDERKNKISTKNASQHYIYLTEPIDKETVYYVTSFGHEYLLPDYYLKRQNNDLFMINYVVNGALSLTVDGETKIMKSGDLCFLNLMKPSEMFPVEEDTEIYFFHFQGKNLKHIYNAYVAHGNHVISDVPLAEIEKMFSDLGSFVENNDDFFCKSALLYSFLMRILSLRDKSKQSTYPRVVSDILKYLYVVFPTPTPNEIANHFGYNQIYLERLFKQYVGESLGVYIQRKKYGQACQYLIDSNMSINEIALMIGYKTPQGLIALFKKFGDTTPLAYRKSMKEIR